MRFIKVGRKIINLDRVCEIYLKETGDIAFWYGQSSYEDGDWMGCHIVYELHSSYPALSAWLAAGMPIHTPFLDIDAWFAEQSKPTV